MFASSDALPRTAPARAALLALTSLLAFACASDSGSARPDNESGGGGSGGNRGSSAGQGGLPGVGAGGEVSTAGTSAGGQTGSAGSASGGSSNAVGGAGGSSAAAGGSAAGGVPSGGSGSISDVPRLGGPLKILPFGDSITASTCYRARLAELLDEDHAGDYDFVGSQDGDKGCGYTYDTAHEGHGGYLITQHTGELAGWAAANPTDVVLLHFATNDVWNNVPTDTILAAYGQAVDEFREQNANVAILVAKLIPLEPSGCGHCDVGPLNAAIPAWAESKTTATSPIIVVDQHSGYSAGADSEDMVHPNDTGSSKMAARWAEALDPLF